ncbi:hypothetical protein TRIP_B10092 [uncultured Desulfatiglans sp.]|uniref:Uncharacterized protein n=1 Tax=Uncultured Desulfatiglans sp. TaxID=1748965 RepID=A0A653A031_UNCDX|nr:hypothetical protein TRIP_B10092 [uncultured Desulfatiglans sp.]
MTQEAMAWFEEEEEIGTIRCAICGMAVDSVEEALDCDWAPFFYEGNDQHGPACASCSSALMRVDEFGEMEIKEEYRGKIRYLDEPLEDDGDFVFMGAIYN